MSQSVLPFEYVAEKLSSGLTSWGGIGVLFELIEVLWLRHRLDMVGLRPTQGWPDSVMALTIVLINILGGDGVDDVALLAADEGLCRLFRQAILHNTRGKQRKRLLDLMDLAGSAFPSASSLRRWLDRMHAESDDELREEGKAVILPATNPVRELWQVISGLVEAMQQASPSDVATIDMDATLIPTRKKEALFCYKKFQAYQPLNFWWAEHQWMHHSQFRDGNVPAGYNLLEAFKEALNKLPNDVKKVQLRSDSAGHVNELLRYCAEGKNEHFGVIEFAIAAKMTSVLRTDIGALPESAWAPVYQVFSDGQRIRTKQEWASVSHHPNEPSRKKNGPAYNFMAVRTPLPNFLPGIEIEPTATKLDDEAEVELAEQRYKITALVTNKPAGHDVITWLRARCGDSEQVHATLKNDLAGGRMPSARFGSNAAWWALTCLSANLLTLLKRLALTKSLAKARVKRIRFSLLNVAARVTERARRLVVRISANHPALALIIAARKRLSELALPPPVLTSA